MRAQVHLAFRSVAEQVNSAVVQNCYFSESMQHVENLSDVSPGKKKNFSL